MTLTANAELNALTRVGSSDLLGSVVIIFGSTIILLCLEELLELVLRHLSVAAIDKPDCSA
jgi:hypothetical protein